MPNFILKIINFLKEVKTELKKVTWPTKKEVIRYTVIILGTSLFVAVLLGGFDLIFQEILERFILKI